MKSHKEMLERLKWYVGRYIDFDGAYQAQCQDLIVDYVYWATDKKVRVWGNAIDTIRNDFGKYATIHKNTKEFLPQVGDIAVWTKPPAHPKYGHIGIVYGDVTLETCTMLDQNWDGDPSKPARLRTDDYRGITHFIRINFEKDLNKHTVKKGDTLYSIAKANKITVDELKKLNNLKSNTIHTGDKLKVKASPIKPQVTTANTTPRTIGSWKTNKINGAQYIQAAGTFTVGSEPIMSRWDNPIVGNNQAGWVKAGTKIKYNYLVRANGYVWIQYEVKGRQRFVPFNTWNSKTGAVGKNGEWGTFS